jgi:hypothetical protein
VDGIGSVDVLPKSSFFCPLLGIIFLGEDVTGAGAAGGGEARGGEAGSGEASGAKGIGGEECNAEAIWGSSTAVAAAEVVGGASCIACISQSTPEESEFSGMSDKCGVNGVGGCTPTELCEPGCESGVLGVLGGERIR